QLVVAERLLPLDEWLDGPAFDQPGKTWRQTFVPGALEAYQWRGRTYAIPFATGTSLLWYDQKLWREHGWTVPQTWDELLAVGEQIKAAGIAPVAFQGKYWGYAQRMFESILYGLHGPRFFAEVDAMQPGVFRDARYLEAARRMQQFATGYFQPGCMAMTHTEAQLEFLRHRAALVWCGTHLRNEMKDYIPADFELSGFAWPRMRPNVPRPVELSASALIVFADGRAPRAAAEFLPFMTSRQQARRFVEMSASPSPVVGAADGVVTPGDVRETMRLIESAPALRSPPRLFQVYPALRPHFDALFGDLLKGHITPEEFGIRMERAAEEVRHEPVAQRFRRLLDPEIPR
ncbi:MAG: extracellular solute-binding protein, partial [Fimbriimonas ginsengisoli]|nr:extracellular solute-binding protein [Fimbriimonas ginsengisoli]